MVWKRTQKSTCCLLLARFLFVNLFIAVASLFTWRGRREGVSWEGEPISWKFGDFLSCIQYLWFSEFSFSTFVQWFRSKNEKVFLGPCKWFFKLLLFLISYIFQSYCYYSIHNLTKTLKQIMIIHYYIAMMNIDEGSSLTNINVTFQLSLYYNVQFK